MSQSVDNQTKQVDELLDILRAVRNSGHGFQLPNGERRMHPINAMQAINRLLAQAELKGQHTAFARVKHHQTVAKDYREFGELLKFELDEANKRRVASLKEIA